MKKFYFLELFPSVNADGWLGSGNRVLAELVVMGKANELRPEAIKKFKEQFSKIPLDNDGYAKMGNKTYCIAESFH